MFKRVEFLKSVYNPKDLPPPKLPEIAFLGRSNVGKSSLINAFLNRKKVARVSSTPGFTKAINFFSVDNKFYLVDLPGYGFAKVPPKLKKLWASLVESYLTSIRDFRLLILIFDIRRNPDNLDTSLIEFVQSCKKPFCIVLNKIDLLKKKEVSKRKEEILKALNLKDVSVFLTSCKEKTGIEQLRCFIFSHIEK
ncbi:MAG: YihA family ribosome biogenesis GTP-binding protein [Thermodesulfobacteria bacterium]|nr:YihA family ribosome biogenesis GTP-binding protein [Thermodesulfobacteriota bacterium]